MAEIVSGKPNTIQYNTTFFYTRYQLNSKLKLVRSCTKLQISDKMLEIIKTTFTEIK